MVSYKTEITPNMVAVMGNKMKNKIIITIDTNKGFLELNRYITTMLGILAEDETMEIYGYTITEQKVMPPVILREGEYEQ